QITSAISINAVSNGGLGVQTVSLRGLGAERTLVLLNSRRAGPAGTRGAVASFDLNVLPSSIIKSVEILKDGASSVYGSDAIAGVVNMLTKTETNGLEINGFSSVPLAGGGETYSANAVWGKEFGRGHILIAGDYYKRRELERRDRRHLGCPETYLRRSDGSRADLIDPRTDAYQCAGTVWGHVWSYHAGNLPAQPLTLLQYDYPGDNLGRHIPGLAPASQPGDLIPAAGWYPVGYNGNPTATALVNRYHPFERKSSVEPETSRHTLYADGSFAIADGIELYGEGLFNRRRTSVDSYSQFYIFGYTDLYAAGDADDPFPGWSSSDASGVFVSPTGILDQYDNETRVDYYRAVGGVRGDITPRVRFDIFGQYSQSRGRYRLQQIVNDVITQQTERAFGMGCAGLVTPISNRQCVQMNWVDPRVMAGDLTPAELAYLTDTEVGKTRYRQQFIEASITGEAFDLPAGPLGFAVGAVVRRDSINDRPGHITMAANPAYDPALPTDHADYAPPYVDNGFSNDFSSGHSFGHSISREAFAEVGIPVLRDAPLARSLTLAGAARVTDVKAVRGQDGFRASSKGNWTYKMTANWQVNDWVRLRGTFGTSYRAPALFEQFLAGQVTTARQSGIDPCVMWGDALGDGTITQRTARNCAADGIASDHVGSGIPAQIFTSGGIGELKPETSTARTMSVIFTPRFAALPDTAIDLTIDYFDIRVKGEIQLLDTYSIVYGCYNSDNFPDSPLCDMFERGQDGNPQNIRTISQKYVNVDRQVNRGFDATLRVRHDMGRMGTLSFLGQATLQTRDRINRLGELDDLNGTVGDPKFTADLNLDWKVRKTTLFYGMTIIGKSSSVRNFVKLNGGLCNPTPDAVALYGDHCYSPRTPAVYYHNASITQDVGDRFAITLGVTNMFNTRPPRVSGVNMAGNAPFVSQYDWLGRRMFLSAKARF
ncbi:MAG: TonB-dependent receptor, partial [Sphingobium sp.]